MSIVTSMFDPVKFRPTGDPVAAIFRATWASLPCHVKAFVIASSTSRFAISEPVDACTSTPLARLAHFR